MPLLSIIIPVYNVENYLEECLNSILNQNFTDYEIILVDDASTDKSGYICDEYALKYENIKVIHLKCNSLLGAARNIGLKNAIGEYVHFCDADDLYIENSLNYIAENLNYNNSDVVVGHFICKPEKGAFICNDIEFGLDDSENISSDILINYHLISDNIMGIACRFIVKREFLLLNKIFFLEGYYAEDEEWVPTILCTTKNFYEIKKAFYCYRPRKIGSITSKKTYLHSKSQLIVALNLLKLLDDKNYDGIRKDFIYSRVNNLLGIFSTRCDTFTKDQIKELSEIINKNLNIIKYLDDINDRRFLYECINEMGVNKGMIYYCSNIVIKTLGIVKNKKNKDIYIFPTGYNGEGTARILKNADYKVKGFLDNSDTKNGCIIDDIEVNKPVIIKNLSNEQINNIFIIISTQKKQVVEILKNQLRELNIKDEQMAVRIY